MINLGDLSCLGKANTKTKALLLRYKNIIIPSTMMIAVFSYGNVHARHFFSWPSVQNNPTELITFIELNDLHAHLTPHKDLKHQNGSKEIVVRGGLARIKTLVDGIRSENPNSIFMNIGDTFHGGVEANYTQGNAIVTAVNALGIDVGVPGNWDFAYGPMVTRARFTDGMSLGLVDIEKPNYPNLGGNVRNQLLGTEMLPATLIKNIGGVKVGMIGITSDIVERMYEMFALTMDFLQGETAYIDYVNRNAQSLRDRGAHIVVVMSELGIHKDYEIANKINADLVDVFFSAHTHELTDKPIQSRSGALVVEAGNDTFLGRMDIQVTNGKVTSKRWNIIPIEENIAEDRTVKSLVDSIRAPFLADNVSITNPMMFIDQTLDMPIDTIVGYVGNTLHRRHALESVFNNALTDSLKQIGGTDLAITPGFRFDQAIEANEVTQGAVTLEEAYRFFPMPYDIGTATVTGTRIREVIEENLNFVFSNTAFEQSGGWTDGYSGLTINVNLSAPNGRRVESLKIGDSSVEVRPDDVFTITGCVRPLSFNSDILCGYSGFSNVTPLEKPEGGTYTGVDLFLEALSLGNFASQPRKNINDSSGTSMWPENDFVQPLTGATGR